MTSLDANAPIPNLRLRISLIQAKSGTMTADETLFTTEVDDVKVNEPIRLGYPDRFNDQYMGILNVKIEVLDGDSSLLKTAILTTRHRRGT